ncbi:cytochrome C biogenesis protein ResB [Geobacter sp. SVR]|uniref:cytochrome C biogenesis protein ResB n=1 Tax=Geobacter sp. SVR TaxID=2495594 RepID=UPI00143EFA16|nr:cytochrome C biogenesis protein ResB [Geobacter sp. SVR]BCS52961.1 cytochrome c biogenesis protein ResB [Geobacter sp. SVR]GCF84345.1 cytochrome c biogenesis protein ResB [Geobacter sp. SVR]
MKRLWNALISLQLSLWLLALLCLAMAAGSFLLKGEQGAAINFMPFFAWLMQTPVSHSWWLWLTLVLLALVVITTLLCSWDAVMARWRRIGFIALIAPQLVHAGFLLIVAAHLISALGSSVQQFEVHQGELLQLPDGQPFGVAAITVQGSPMGMPLGFSAELVTDLRNPSQRVTISPNHPWFSEGYGVYIKQAVNAPYPRALLEVHREPGAGMALSGAIAFVIGNLLVLWLRSKRDGDMRGKTDGSADEETTD